MDNHKRETIERAWAEADGPGGFLVVVSIPHGAELPSHLSGVVRLRLGRTLPITFAMNGDGFEGDLGVDFGARVPWRAVAAVITDAWVTQWTLGEIPEPERPTLRRIK